MRTHTVVITVSMPLALKWTNCWETDSIESILYTMSEICSTNSVEVLTSPAEVIYLQ